MLIVRRVTKEQFAALHRKMLELARADEDCRLLMTVPGVGMVVAMTYRAAINEPARFRRSRAVGAHFGLVPRTYQSGEIDRRSRIIKSGDETVRTAVFEAALVLLRPNSKPSALKAWEPRIAKRRCMARAIVAVTRKMAVTGGAPAKGNEVRDLRQPKFSPSEFYRIDRYRARYSRWTLQTQTGFHPGARLTFDERGERWSSPSTSPSRSRRHTS